MARRQNSRLITDSEFQELFLKSERILAEADQSISQAKLLLKRVQEIALELDPDESVENHWPRTHLSAAIKHLQDSEWAMVELSSNNFKFKK